ncbi:MAG: OstA-like protein [Microscillaceae bacterium]|nr:OstA-like protein [Microscillaceae bacterium]
MHPFKLEKLFKILTFALGGLLWMILNGNTAQAQNIAEDNEKITLERAEELVKDQRNPNVRKLLRQVIVRHKGSVLYCDSAYLHEDKNIVDAFGNARLISEDGTQLSSDSMFYNGETRIARARGDVLLVDQDMRLNTQALDYNMDEGVAYYYAGGKIVDSEKTLESQAGSYDTNSKIFYFREDVELILRSDGRKVRTDDLKYNTISKLAYFQGPTWIEGSNGTVYTEKGTFNTETEASNFQGRTRVDNKDYYLEGDSLYVDNASNYGYARGNVLLFAKLDSVIINGDFGWVKRGDGEAKVYGNALMRNITQGDTLYLKADTMYSIDQKEKGQRLMLTYPKTRIYKTEFQGICDSLVYNRTDSTIYLFRDPVLWNEGSQITADSISLQMSNNKLYRMNTRVNSYLISLDSLSNYNQLKGKNMIAYFQDNQIRRVDVRGNGQNIYFALEGDSILVGMNRVECSDMNILFAEKNKLNKISYLNKADAVFVPPHEIEEPQTKFKNFSWRIDEKPTKSEMITQPILVRKD